MSFNRWLRPITHLSFHKQAAGNTAHSPSTVRVHPRTYPCMPRRNTHEHGMKVGRGRARTKRNMGTMHVLVVVVSLMLHSECLLIDMANKSRGTTPRTYILTRKFLSLSLSLSRFWQDLFLARLLRCCLVGTGSRPLLFKFFNELSLLLPPWVTLNGVQRDAVHTTTHKLELRALFL